MPDAVTLPFWLALVLVVLAAIAVIDRLLTPSVRWLLRRRVERVLDEVHTRLQIRIQPFKLNRRQTLIDRLIHDPRIAAEAESFAETENLPRREVAARVERYAREIVPAFNAYIYFRFGYWLSRRIARALYRVRLGAIDDEALAAVPPDSTVVFVMNHRSNMDYILVSYLAAERTALSYAVGEWARIWPLESLVRSMGAYFVRRRSRNVLYRRVLRRYVEIATRQGVTQAVFPEGGLSRDGLLQPPKLGLLDYMLSDFDPAGPRDIVVVPVGINYDRVLEDRTLLLDLDPEAPRRHALGGTLAFLWANLKLLLRGRWYRFGYACVGFGRPVSMRAWLAGRDLDFRRLERSERFARLGELAGELMGEVGRAIPALPVALVATVLLRRPAQALSELEIKSSVHDLMSRIEGAGGRVYLPRENREYALEVGLRMLRLRRLIEVTDEGLLRPRPREVQVLRYYANSLVHLGEW
ncbi:MAG: 1-acyl-sn-glycerol-3-phosphate acyltransferase [Thermoanaerobaculia bacterium]